MADDYLKFNEILRYEPDSGLLFWKKPGVGRSLNRPLGKGSAKRYVAVSIGGKTYLGHRVAWLLTYKVWPTHDIDHIDHNRSNNRISNLREATNSENLRNRTLQSNNKYGVNGINYSDEINRWYARISVDKKRIHLGYFRTKEAAIQARQLANEKFGFHENHGKEK